jgi:hypothetical protein
MELMHVEHRELAINKYYDNDYNNNNKIGQTTDILVTYAFLIFAVQL